MPKSMSDPIWEHWIDVLIDGKRTRVECKYCKNNNQLKNAPKCKNHIVKCSKAPITVRNRFKIEMEAKDMLRRQGVRKRLDLKQDLQLITSLEPQLMALQESKQEDPEPTNHMEDRELGEESAVYESYPLISVSKNYCLDRNKTYTQSRSFNETLSSDAIVRYIDTFHRLKEDMNYLLNDTTVERKREFLSFALEVIGESMTEEDKIYLNQEIVELSAH